MKQYNTRKAIVALSLFALCGFGLVYIMNDLAEQKYKNARKALRMSDDLHKYVTQWQSQAITSGGGGGLPNQTRIIQVEPDESMKPIGMASAAEQQRRREQQRREEAQQQR